MGLVKRIAAGLVVLGMVVAAVYGLTATRREHNYRVLIEQGEAALAHDDTSAAADAFSGAIALKPDSMLGYLKRGETYRRRNELDAALRDLRHASELDPLAPRPMELLGDVHYALGRAERGDANVAIGRFRKAAELYQGYVNIDDQSPRVLYKLALAHQAAGQPAPAVTALRMAVALDDRFAEAHYLLGVCLRDLNKLPEALASLERARTLAPAMVHARESLAELYGQMGRTRDRIAQLEALAALEPGPSRAVALGLAYHRAGNTNRAVIVLGEAAERFSDHPYAYVALGRVWLETAEASRDRVALSKAIGALQEAAGNDDSSEGLMLLGRALLLSGEDELAERMLQRSTEKFPVDPLAFFYYAEVSERRGHVDAARRALLDYEALEGEDLDQRRRAALAVRVADLSMSAKDPAAATTWYERAGAMTALDAAVLVRLADAQLRTGDAAAARDTIAKALEKDPLNRAALQLQRRLQ